jgi:hypothetical protein
LSEPLKLKEALVLVVEAEGPEEMVVVGGVVSTTVLLTVTETGLEVVVLPEESVATAESVWVPLATPVVFQE